MKDPNLNKIKKALEASLIITEFAEELSRENKRLREENGELIESILTLINRSSRVMETDRLMLQIQNTQVQLTKLVKEITK